jgi:adenine-specific DNA methylase
MAITGSGESFRREMVKAYSAMTGRMPENGLQVVMFTHQDARVWGDMAGIFWGAGLQVTAAWYIATETVSELKQGGYVQGTVIMVLRKRRGAEQGYKDEVVLEIRREVARQIETMVGLNQRTQAHGRSENLFEDADLQMAGYAAALRVLTGYTEIDGRDMTRDAVRPRTPGETSIVDELIEFAVAIANEHLVPEGLDALVWERLTGSERFYLRMLEVERAGAKKLDNYQNFAKAFRVASWQPLMATVKPNDARLKSAAELRRAEFTGSEFGGSMLRGVLHALFELQSDVEPDHVMSHLRDNVNDYLRRRNEIAAVTAYIARSVEQRRSEEASAARILHGLVRNEKLA